MDSTKRTDGGTAAPVAPELRLDYRQLFVGTPQPMWIFDTETLAFLDVNDVAIRHYGYSRDEFLGMTIKAIRPSDGVPRLLAHLPKTRSEPTTTTTRWRHRKQDGSVIDVEITSFRVRFAGRPARLVMVNDVTERNEAQARNRYHAFLLGAITDAVVATDDAFVITSWNAAAERIYGWTADEVLGRPATEFIPSELSGIARSEMLRGLTETGRLSADAIQRHKNGDPIHVEIRAVALVDESGDKLGYVSVNRDITERIRAQDTIRGLLNAGVAAQEEERTRIARELHDDTGQALSAMIVGLKTMSETTTVEELRGRAADLRRLASRALDQIQRIARGLRPASLDAMGLETALEHLAIEVSHAFGIRVDVHCDAVGQRLSPAHEIALYRIAQESLTNVGRHAAAETASLVVQRDAGRVRLIVEDDGRGFEPSVETSGRFGLQGMRERVALLGGSITVESAPGKGTAVSVSLPVEAR